ncbi:MAG: isoprenylcysteine carboxylmethyltransferase family protein [Armatimonadota bacterium]|nr:isoprenylcysteine carboxylmethyltransferase family protein [Armatimonadota bacterium]MDR7519966.1 isoprenylcysteine carboxylmethyltransferase family protein [Armatimonadota bacterium]MDR7548585.1 isoprenylcysteine carboxylmethyltransferase family protein [Armatimonadota bacterium]
MHRRIGWDGVVLLVLIVLLVGLGAYYARSPDAAAALWDEGPWYGNWGAVAFSVLLFTAFVVALLRPFERRDWRGLGVAEAYLVALFTEMFGVPLTIYLLGSVLGVKIGFSGLEGHLWATLLDRVGWLPQEQGVALVMGISTVLILAGLVLMAAGWWLVWRARGELVTRGLYGWVRHPQYTGLILIIVAFLIQWPTIITLLMFPILVATYRSLARKEEAELEARFGEMYTAYRRRVPMFLPRPVRESRTRIQSDPR